MEILKRNSLYKEGDIELPKFTTDSPPSAQTGKVKVTALLQKFGSKNIIYHMMIDIFVMIGNPY